MINHKDTDSKVTKAKRNITISNVTVKDGQFVDENGFIADAVAELLPDPEMSFTIKISIERDEE